LWLAAAFAAALCSNQFLAFTAPTALHLYLAVAFLVVSGVPETKTEEKQPAPRWGWLAALPVPVALAVFALRLAAADVLFLEAQRHAAAGEIASAVQQYDRVRNIGPWGLNVDLWFSRWMIEAAQTRAVPADHEQAWQAAISAGQSAAAQAGERQIARYNLALLFGLQGDAQKAEAALRRTIETAPAWYKPRWMLAQLLSKTGRPEEALAEAERAYELNGGENEEVTQTRDQLRAARASGR
jgi:tetratricopeptide (TPR) repeat protein